MCSTLLDKVLREPTRARVCLFHNSLPTLYQLHPKVSLQNVQYLILKPNQSCYFVWSILIKQNSCENLKDRKVQKLWSTLFESILSLKATLKASLSLRKYFCQLSCLGRKKGKTDIFPSCLLSKLGLTRKMWRKMKQAKAGS